MGKDPAFLFYPGDYLRDTQTLSENSQVAYDRIMCEHMRNICISQQQLKFFTKRLNNEELDELMFVLTEIDGGFQITWVADSIVKRREYSESRRKNRQSAKPKKNKKHMLTYDNHMENEIENVNEVVSKIENPFSDHFLPIWAQWKDYKKSQFKFQYKAVSTEQAALTDLMAKSRGNEQTAIEIIHQSIANGWKGFFELKNSNNGTSKQKLAEALHKEFNPKS